MSNQLKLWCLLAALAGCAARRAPVMSAEPVEDERAQAAQLFVQGKAFADAGDLTRAEQYLATALRLGHSPERTLRALLSVCVRASRLRSALTYAAPHLMAHPQDVSLRQLVASLHLALGEVPAAERELTRVLAEDAAAADAQFLLATILQQYPNRRDDARDHFARYVALRPTGSHAEEARASLASLAPGEASLD